MAKAKPKDWKPGFKPLRKKWSVKDFVPTVTQSPGRYEIVKTRAGKWRVKYYGKNGEMLANSEVLNSKKNADKNIAAMARIFKHYCFF